LILHHVSDSARWVANELSDSGIDLCLTDAALKYVWPPIDKATVSFVSQENRKDTGWNERGVVKGGQVGVHIADVTTFLRPSTAMDDEAALR
jgi:hypothetical protein